MKTGRYSSLNPNHTMRSFSGKILHTAFRLFGVCLVPVWVFLSPLSGQDSRSELEAKRMQTLKEIEETSAILKQNEASQTKSLQQLNLLASQLSQRRKLLSQILQEVNAVDRDISKTRSTISTLEKELALIRNEYAQHLRDYQRKQYSRQIWLYVFGSEDMTQAYRRHKYFQQYTNSRRARYDSAMVYQSRLKGSLAQLALQRESKDSLLDIQQNETKKLSQTKSTFDSQLSRLRSNATKLKRDLASKREVANRLNREIEAFIVSTAKEKGATSGDIYSKLTPKERIISDNFAENQGRLPWPTSRGTIVGLYGDHAHPVLKGVMLPTNHGIDIATDKNASVCAVFDGEVSKIVAIKGANYTIIVRHGKFLTVYQNLINIKVKQGDKVSRNQALGTVFTDPVDQSSVYHFEVWEEMKKHNPSLWIVTR